MKLETNELVGKEFQFIYPDEKGEAKTHKFLLLAQKQDAENFDKFWNLLMSLSKANNINMVKIFDYMGEIE